ncbi:MAG TPA: ATP-binding protein [Candidatus Eisenbacteria bacterium]|jgi:anti-sigma regulatory factor (Ser/Thr protein kinase)
MKERRFRRELRSLEAIHEFVTEFLAAHGLPDSHSFDVDLILEELFTNMVRHSREGSHDIAIALERDGRDVTIRLRDFDVQAYDVTDAPAFDIRQPLSQRRPGGMGLHLVRQIADTIRYQYADRISTITVTKRLDP